MSRPLGLVVKWGYQSGPDRPRSFMIHAHFKENNCVERTQWEHQLLELRADVGRVDSSPHTH